MIAQSFMDKSREILQKIWGYSAFRPLQEEIVDAAIYGHDTLAILPTGGGKSICFQVPGIARDGLTIVVSPLIALMQDQVSNLRKKGVKADLITSNMTYREIDIALDNARFGKLKFLYTSPERLKSSLFVERFKLMNIGLIVVDEAHCISEWGHDFRPAYRDIVELREHHPEVPVIALTASATQEVQDDIVKVLDLRKVKIFKGSLKRENISYRVAASENKSQSVLEYCREHILESGIVYCQTRRSVKDLVRLLRSHRISAGMYHGGMSSDDRKYMLEHWMKGSIKVMVATNAFGMGIDKPDVRFVLHFEMPNNLEAYYQEAGRAGRDEKSAVAIAFWERSDLDTMRTQLKLKYPDKDRIKQIYEGVCNFLKVAIGSGENESYPFDIRLFAKQFSMQVTEVYNALCILELNGSMQLSEGGFLPTRLKFNIGSSAIYKFQVSHEGVSNLITLITRSYPGVFDRFVSIDEKEFATRLKISSDELRKKLEFLEKYGVIDVHFQSVKPQLVFLNERLPPSNFTILNAVYEKRKQVEQHKLDSMIEYICSENCRSELIASYFGSPTEKCGKCDVCASEISNAYSFEELLELLPDLLPATITQLSEKTNTGKEFVQKALHALILEERIQFEDRVYRISS